MQTYSWPSRSLRTRLLWQRTVRPWRDLPNACLHNCGGHGRCLLDGACSCELGYGGPSCKPIAGQAAACALGGSGNGLCAPGGTCVCEPGFAGKACEWAGGHAACASNCSAHGLCVRGRCTCHAGFTGATCERVVPRCVASCSGHGWCVMRMTLACAISGIPACTVLKSSGAHALSAALPRANALRNSHAAAVVRAIAPCKKQSRLIIMFTCY